MNIRQSRVTATLAKTVVVALAMLLLAPAISFGVDVTPAHKGAPKPPKAVACNEKIAFISLHGFGQDEMEAPLLQLKSQTWPAKSLQFQYTTNDGSDMAALVNEVEARVTALEASGVKRIALPSYSRFLVPFIHGTGPDSGSLGGVNLKTRHPNSVFVTINNATDAVDDPVAASNVFRFLDVPSFNALSDLALSSVLGTGGSVLVLYEAGDAVAESVRDGYLAQASLLGAPASTVALTFDGDYDADQAAAKAAVDALPSGSVVVHVPNGVNGEAYTLSGLAGGIFVAASVTGPISHLAGNYYPVITTIPVPLAVGYSLVDRPSLLTERLGFAVDYDAWLADPRTKQYIEAYGWLAKCGRFDGVFDHLLQFDAGGTKINFEYEQLVIPAGSLTLTAVGRPIENPRWSAERFAWDWKTVFGH
jgi:hypothetical protein